MPQSLNRYGATSLGAPGVAEGGLQSLGLLQTTRNSLIVSLVGETLNSYASHNVYLYTHISHRDFIARYPRLFERQPNSLGEVRSRIQVKPLGNGWFSIPGAKEPLNLREFATFKRRGKYLRTYFSVSDDVLKKFLNSPWGEFGPGFALDLAFAIPDVLSTWQNPYFNTEQRLVQYGVTFGGVLAGTGAGLWVGNAAAVAGLGGPATFVAVTVSGVIVFAAWEGVIKPGVSLAAPYVGLRDPYQEYRNLRPLEGE